MGHATASGAGAGPAASPGGGGRQAPGGAPAPVATPAVASSSSTIPLGQPTPVPPIPQYPPGTPYKAARHPAAAGLAVGRARGLGRVVQPAGAPALAIAAEAGAAGLAGAGTRRCQSETHRHTI